MENKIVIHTDGSCIGNPGPGGWASIIHYKNKEEILTGGDKDTTNNRMEMMAVVESLVWLHTKSKIKKDDLPTVDITIYSDSNLIIQTMNKGWKKKANTDLWEEIERLSAWLNIKWIWVKAHDTNKYNNIVDAMALKEAQKFAKS